MQRDGLEMKYMQILTEYSLRDITEHGGLVS